MVSAVEPLCACGKPLHYTDPKMQTFVEAMVAEKGETVVVRHESGKRYPAQRRQGERDVPVWAPVYVLERGRSVRYKEPSVTKARAMLASCRAGTRFRLLRLTREVLDVKE